MSEIKKDAPKDEVLKEQKPADVKAPDKKKDESKQETVIHETNILTK